MQSTPLDPDALCLIKARRGTTYWIVYRRRVIGQVESVPVMTMAGPIDPPIVLRKPFSERFKDQIRDLVNKRDGTNRNIRVVEAPRHDHPAILKFLERQRLKW